MESDIIKKTIEIPMDEIRKWERLMNLDPGMIDLEAEGIFVREPLLAVWTADFGNGIEVDVKVCLSVGFDELPAIWSEANFVEGGVESYSTEPEYKLSGPWYLPKIHGKQYVVEVVGK